MTIRACPVEQVQTHGANAYLLWNYVAWRSCKHVSPAAHPLHDLWTVTAAPGFKRFLIQRTVSMSGRMHQSSSSYGGSPLRHVAPPPLPTASRSPLLASILTQFRPGHSTFKSYHSRNFLESIQLLIDIPHITFRDLLCCTNGLCTLLHTVEFFFF